MKKSLVYLAVTAASIAPLTTYAESPFYGRGEVRIIEQQDEELSITVNKMRFGAKDSFELEYVDGMTGFYHLEWQYDANETDGSSTEADSSTTKSDTTVRKAMVGVKGSYGELHIGRQSNPAYSAYKNDNFKKGSGAFVNTRSRFGNAMTYYSPKINDISLFFTIAADDTDTNEDIDTSVYGAKYKADNLEIVVASTTTSKEYLSSTNDKEIFNLGLRYKLNDLTLNASYEDASLNTGVDETLIALAAIYKVGHANYKIGREMLDVDGGANESQWILHAGLKLDPHADVYVQYNAENEGAGNDDAFSTGLNITF